jgi:uncharacterized membrane protein YoaK (UPF0700 family)
MTSYKYAQPEDWLPYELAFVGGYCDAGSFVLTKTFTGQVTGNLVLAAIAVAAHDWRSLLAHFSAIGAFLLATVLSMLMMRRLQLWPSAHILASIMLIEAILIACASLMTSSEGFPKREIFLVLMSLGFGLQNGSFTRAGGIGIRTTYITGVITNLLFAETTGTVAKTLAPNAAKPAPAHKLLGRVWVTFVPGAGSGAAALRFESLGLLGASVQLCLFSLIEVQQ